MERVIQHNTGSIFEADVLETNRTVIKEMSILKSEELFENVSDNQKEEDKTQDNANMEEEVEMQNVTILKRPEDPGHQMTDSKSDHVVKTISQRQKEYNEARLRIFGVINAEDDDGNGSEIVETTTPKDGENIVEPSTEYPDTEVAENKVDCQGYFYIDVNNYQESEKPPPAEREETPPGARDKPPPIRLQEKTPPAIYSNGSQHPLQYFNQHLVQTKPVINHHGQGIYFYPQYDYASYQLYGGSTYSPNDSNFASDLNFTPVECLAQTSSYLNWSGHSGAYDFGYYLNYAQSDQTYYSASPYLWDFIDADYLQYVEQRFYHGHYTMGNA